jgi:hypothetical protein
LWQYIYPPRKGVPARALNKYMPEGFQKAPPMPPPSPKWLRRRRRLRRTGGGRLI